MGALIYCILLAGLVILCVNLLKTYRHIPLKELRRQARSNDKFASSAYKVANYGRSAELLLWVIASLAAAGLFIKLSEELEWWLALIGVFVLICLVYWWVPNREVKKINKRLAILCAPLVARLLSLLMPPLKWAEKQIDRFMPLTVHSGLYEKEDLLELLDAQATQADSRISEREIEIAKNSLTFSDKLVREVMTPKRMMKTLMVEDQISPHILDEIHGSGYSRLPVYEADENGTEKVVGILYTKDLIDAVHAGSIGGVMDKKVYFVQEELDLGHVLSAFLKTKHHLFVVVNKFEEPVGVISIEDILEQIIGRPIVDEFDEYDDLRKVAGLEASKESETHEVITAEPDENTENQTDKKVVE